MWKIKHEILGKKSDINKTEVVFEDSSNIRAIDVSQKEMTFEHKTEVITSGIRGEKSMLPFQVEIDPKGIKYSFAFDWLDLLVFVYLTWYPKSLYLFMIKAPWQILA